MQAIEGTYTAARTCRSAPVRQAWKDESGADKYFVEGEFQTPQLQTELMPVIKDLIKSAE